MGWLQIRIFPRFFFLRCGASKKSDISIFRSFMFPSVASFRFSTATKAVYLEITFEEMDNFVILS
jgi:hypothetical protein